MLWDMFRKHHFRIFQGDLGCANCVALGRDEPVSLCDITPGRSSMTLGGHSSSVLSIAFSPDGSTLAIRNGDGFIDIWDIFSKALSSNWPGSSYSINSIAFDPKGAIPASGRGDNSYQLSDTVNQKLLGTPTECGSWVI